MCLSDPEDAVPVPANRGDIVVFSSLTPHCTGPNLTDEVRKAYIVQYAPTGAAVLRPGTDGSVARVAADDPGRQYEVLTAATRSSARRARRRSGGGVSTQPERSAARPLRGEAAGGSPPTTTADAVTVLPCLVPRTATKSPTFRAEELAVVAVPDFDETALNEVVAE